MLNFKKIGAIAIAAILLSACWLQYKASSIMTEHVWTPLSQPVKIRHGTIVNQSFLTDLDDNYEISVAIERKAPYETIKCLLGIQNNYSEDCQSKGNAVSMEWVILTETKIIAKGSSENEHGSYWEENVGRVIGHFQPTKNGQYLIQIKSKTDGTVLDFANPTIKIAVSPNRFKKAFTMRWLYSVGAIIAVTLSLALSIAIIINGKKTKSF